MTAPSSLDLDALKDDIGMTGSVDDAWLQRRIDGTWARFERYCARHLGDVTTFKDAWAPPAPSFLVLAYGAASPYSAVPLYLRNFPVASIEIVTEGGAPIDPASVLFASRSGLLLGYGEPTSPSRFRAPIVTYKAGYTEVPGDLYEALVGVLRAQWASRSTDKSGMLVGGLAPNKIKIEDVGEVALAGGTSTGYSAAVAGIDDPLLGPFAWLLDPYVDHRALLGGNAPTTEMITVAP